MQRHPIITSATHHSARQTCYAKARERRCPKSENQARLFVRDAREAGTAPTSEADVVSTIGILLMQTPVSSYHLQFVSIVGQIVRVMAAADTVVVQP